MGIKTYVNLVQCWYPFPLCITRDHSNSSIGSVLIKPFVSKFTFSRLLSGVQYPGIAWYVRIVFKISWIILLLWKFLGDSIAMAMSKVTVLLWRWIGPKCCFGMSKVTVHVLLRRCIGPKCCFGMSKVRVLLWGMYRSKVLFWDV